MTLEEWQQRVMAHDLTHDYSDDHGVWSRGSADYREIQELAQQFPRADVVRIWNTVVDQKLRSGREEYYWK